MSRLYKYFILLVCLMPVATVVGQKDTIPYNMLELKQGLYFLNEELYNGVAKLEYVSGATRHICHFKLGKMNGLFTYYFENERIQVQKPYKDGEVDGKWLEWDREGNKSSERNYKKGKPHGETVFWNSNGDPTLQSYYVNGVKEREETLWYHGEQKFAQTYYKNGLKHGKQTAWYENGNIRYEVNWEDNLRVDTSFAYNEKGNLLQKEVYEKGIKIKRLVYDEKGSSYEVHSLSNYKIPNEVKVIHAKRIIIYEGPLSIEHIYIELAIEGEDVKFSHMIDGYEDVHIGSKQQDYTGISYYLLNGDVVQEKSIVISNFTKYRSDNKNNVTLTRSKDLLKQDYLLSGQIEIHYSIGEEEKVLIVTLEETTDVSFLYGN